MPFETPARQAVQERSLSLSDAEERLAAHKLPHVSLHIDWSPLCRQSAVRRTWNVSPMSHGRCYQCRGRRVALQAGNLKADVRHPATHSLQSWSGRQWHGPGLDHRPRPRGQYRARRGGRHGMHGEHQRETTSSREMSPPVEERSVLTGSHTPVRRKAPPSL